MAYNHTQMGYLIIYTTIAVLLLFVTILIEFGVVFPLLIFMILVLAILASFTTLNVTIDKNYLKIKFGYGIIRKSFILKDIISAKTVKNHWYYGWGIRLWFWPRMLIFNVSGFDAVEIKLKNNKIYRIGTDEPEKLKRAIEKVENNKK